MLDDAVKAHKPDSKSLEDEESTEAYNEEEARAAFGDEFIDRLKEDQARIKDEFTGDWWQLALLRKNLEEDERNPEIKNEERLKAWNKWRNKQDISAYEYMHLEHVRPDGARLEHANLFGAHLEHAHLLFASLEHAFLGNAHLEHAHLVEAHLEHAKLSGAHLEHADLWEADLRGATLLEANLERSDVRGAKGLRFDDNRVEGIHIEGDAPDPWSVLRRKYTGPWFFVHLLLLAIFFSPYVGHALYLTAKSRFQEWSFEQYDALGERVADWPGLSEYHVERKQRFEEKHEQRRAVWVLLGLHKGVVPVALAFIVVLYNAIRGYLTLRVSTLRDAEERSDTTPRLEEYYAVVNPLDLRRPVRLRDILGKWWESHGKRRWLAPSAWVQRTPWVARWLPERFTEIGRPYSLMDCFGLYRLHVAASILLLFALLAVVYNTGVWAVETWIWVPVGS